MTQTAAFHQPTTGTSASPVATCTGCKRGIARQNGGSALWIDADGHTTCPVQTELTLERRVITRPGRSRKNGYAPRTLVVWSLVNAKGIGKEYPTRKDALRALDVLAEYL